VITARTTNDRDHENDNDWLPNQLRKRVSENDERTAMSGNVNEKSDGNDGASSTIGGNRLRTLMKFIGTKTELISTDEK